LPLRKHEEVKSLGYKTTIYDSDIRNEKQITWLKIEDSWLDISVKDINELYFTPRTNIFFAEHEDETFIKLIYQQYKVGRLREYLDTFMKSKDAISNLIAGVEQNGLIDSDERVTMISINGRFVSPECGIMVKDNNLRYISRLPDKEDFIFQNSCVVSEDNSLNFCFQNGESFFRIG
jgi:hypothetical protein